MSHIPNPGPSQVEIDAYAPYVHDREDSSADPKRGAWILGAGVALYTLVVVSLTALGIYAQASPLVFAGTVVASMLGLVGAYFAVPSIRAFAQALGPYGLASFHVWRVIAASAFLFYGSQGWLPHLFVNLAGWGDMLAGVLAAGLIAFPVMRSHLTAFHTIGFADFVVAVGTGLTLMLIDAPQMLNIASLPIALIPLVGVPLSGASHIVAFHLLGQESDV